MRYIKYPTLEERTVGELDLLLTHEHEIVERGSEFDCFLHNALEAVYHSVLMQQVLHVENSLDLTELVKKYGVTLSPRRNGYFMYPRLTSRALRTDGVYLPPVAVDYKSFKLFGENCHDSWFIFKPKGLEKFPEGEEIMNTFAYPPDDFSVFRDTQLCERALRFSQLLFDAAVIDFERFKPGIRNIVSNRVRPWIREPIPENFQWAGDQLTEYYRSIVYREVGVIL